jgi:uncharacterized membrane protein YoaK (UPF0700 family)
MQYYPKSSIALAVCLSALAGFIDSVGFLQLNGYFVSFMSGNSTRLAVVLVQGDMHHAALAGAIIALFVFGAMLGILVSRFALPKRQSCLVLQLVTFLLLSAAVFQSLGNSSIAIALMTLAMGAENAVFQRNGDVAIGLTYMTGTLVKVGQRLADAVLGGEKFAWVGYLLLWMGLIAGGAAGALAFHCFGLGSLWLAVSVSAILTLAVTFFPPGESNQT